MMITVFKYLNCTTAPMESISLHIKNMDLSRFGLNWSSYFVTRPCVLCNRVLMIAKFLFSIVVGLVKLFVIIDNTTEILKDILHNISKQFLALLFTIWIALNKYCRGWGQILSQTLRRICLDYVIRKELRIWKYTYIFFRSDARQSPCIKESLIRSN